MTQRVVLHVGTMKTGTSYLQSVLRAEQDRLAVDGDELPGGLRCPDPGRARPAAAAEPAPPAPPPLAGGRRARARRAPRHRRGVDGVPQLRRAAPRRGVPRAARRARGAGAAHGARPAPGAAGAVAELHAQLRRRRLGDVPAAGRARCAGRGRRWSGAPQVQPGPGRRADRRALVGAGRRRNRRGDRAAAGAPRELLWHRVCEAAGLRPSPVDAATVADNESIGYAACDWLRRANPGLAAGVSKQVYRRISRPVVRRVLAPLREEQERPGLDRTGARFARERNVALRALLETGTASGLIRLVGSSTTCPSPRTPSWSSCRRRSPRRIPTSCWPPRGPCDAMPADGSGRPGPARRAATAGGSRRRRRAGRRRRAPAARARRAPTSESRVRVTRVIPHARPRRPDAGERRTPRPAAAVPPRRSAQERHHVLQRMLAGNRDSLKKAGFVYPFVRKEGMFHAAVELREQYARWGLEPEQIDGTWERLLRRARRFGGPAIISHELFAGARSRDHPTGRRVHLRLRAARGDHGARPGAPVGRVLAGAGQERPAVELRGVPPRRRRPRQRSLGCRRRGRPLALSGPRLGAGVVGAGGAAGADACGRGAPERRAARGALAAVLRRGRPRPRGGLARRRPPRTNASLAVGQIALLRQVNEALGDRLGQPHYAHVVKRFFAERHLAEHGGGRRPVTPPDLARKFDEVVDRWQATIREHGYAVHGDLDELRVAPVGVEAGQEGDGDAAPPLPDEVSDAEILTGVPEVIAALLVEIADLRTHVEGPPEAAAAGGGPPAAPRPPGRRGARRLRRPGLSPAASPIGAGFAVDFATGARSA